MIRFALTILIAIAGAVLGGFGGRLWYALFGQYQFGYEFEGFAEILIGILIGAFTGAAIGWLQPWRRSFPAVLLAIVVAIAAGVVFATGIVYIGDWTNADGPSEIAPFIGILGIPAGPLLIVLLGRYLRRLDYAER